MAYSGKVVRKVLNSFENKEKAAVLAAKNRKKELYKKLPELVRIDERLAETRKEIVGSMINPGDDMRLKLDNIKKNNKNLQQQRKLILEQSGYAENYTEPVYECKSCEDTGYKDGGMCGCLKRALVTESINESGFGEIIKSQTFKNFSLDYYKKGKLDESGLSEYENMATVVESCRNYAKKFDQPNYVKHLMFIGGTGLGKTHLSSAIANDVIKKGYDVCYDSARSILYSFEKERFSRRDEFDSDIIERYMNCDLLIIDDLGTEYTGTMYVSSLYNIINIRLMENKGLIISTNFSQKDIAEKYDERIYSRLIAEFAVVNFVGDDVRFQK